ncbi:armadillo repeat-containing protein 7 [Ostrinia furnacalis]|uniref:armadillo repeat-containing protein 7 n=1 Tax=Ostrinia furnacalis TaxID=93504 RepID=UPI00103BFBE4|nr:armadillo repeat-containing protein 7 [Ostrinia furnacalis]
MFSSRAQLEKRTPENGTDRENFLSLLVDEYLNSSSYDAKCQVLANLANFAYDPINYGYIRDVGVLDIFLYVLKNEADSKLLHFASAGICNLCLDPANAEYILNHMGLQPIIALLESENNETVANCITTLIYLFNEQTQSEINTSDITKKVQSLAVSDDKMLANLATIFLQDICQISD